MVSANATAVSKTANHERAITQDNMQDGIASMPQDAARKIALNWMDIITMEEALGQMGRAAITWTAAPSVQNAIAAMAADVIPADAHVACAGMQPYGWMCAAGEGVKDVMRHYLGKTLPTRTLGMSAEDIAMTLTKGRMQIVALHAESMQDWNDVRMISAAAVKAGAPMVMLVSAETMPPEGVAIDVMNNWAQAAIAVREAVSGLNAKAAIRVIAVADMSAGDLERVMMEAAGMSPQAWMDAQQKNNDGFEMGANAAYLSPVESF